MEACWLAAVVLVPLVYNPHGHEGFQPFKMAFIRAIAAVLACAWAIRAVEGAWRGRKISSKRRVPRLHTALWIGVVGLALAYGIATVLSVDRPQSLWGFYPNRWGIASFLAELVIFAGVASHLRSPAQMDRLAGAIILPTIPICLFAIAEAFGFSPQPVDLELAEHGWRTVSFAGHQISLGAHLGLVIPFTLTRIFEKPLVSGSGARLFPKVVYVATLLLQVAGLLLAKSRGPLLGVLAACTALVVAWAVLRKSRTLLAWGAATAFCAVAFLAILSIPGGPLARLARLPVLSKFASAVPVAKDRADGFRTNLWAEAPGTVLAASPFVFPDGRQDLPPAIRSVAGFGPDTLQGVLPRHWVWIDPEKRLEKSFHNLFWDSWFSLGAFGTGAILLLFATGILLSFRPLGFRSGKRDAAVGSFCGILICLAFVGRFGAGYLGLGVQAGLAAGLVSALASSIIFPRKKETSPGPASRTSLPVIAAGAALVGHLVETAFAFDVASTSLLFYIFLGVVAANARQDVGEAQEDPPLAPVRSLPWALPLLAGLAMTCLTFAFVHLDFTHSMSWTDILSVSLTRITGTGAPSYLVSLVLLPSFAMLGVFAAAEAARQGGKMWPAFLKTLAVAGALAGGYAIVKAVHIAAIGPLPEAAMPVAEVVRHASLAEWLVIIFFVLCVSIFGLLAWTCARSGESGAPRFTRAGIIAASFLAVGLVATAYPLSLRFVLADTAYASANLRAGSPYSNSRQAGLKLLERAIRHDPFSPEYRLKYSEAFGPVAAEMDDASALALLDHAIGVTSEGARISQLSPINLAVAHLYMKQALVARDAEARKSRAIEAQRYFSKALTYDPKGDHIWVESAMMDGDLLGDRDSDRAKMSAAAELIEPGAAGTWAEYYARVSVGAGHPLLKRRYAERGIYHFRRAIESADRKGAPKFALLVGKGTLHRNLRQSQEALADFQAAAKEGHATDAWRAEAMLAHTLNDQGDKPAAFRHAMRARVGAPKELHEDLNQLLSQILNQ